MLDFSFTEEQNMLRQMVKDFAKKEVAPGTKDRMKARTIPLELLKKMGELGLLGLNVPEQYGGEPKEAVTIGVVLEEMSRWAGDAAIMIFNSFASSCFLALGTEKIKSEWFPKVARGEAVVCMGATEAEAGSDLGNLKTIARKEGDYYIINGEKNRVSFGKLGSAIVVLAKTSPTGKAITPFLVPFNLPGVSMSPTEDMGAESTESTVVSLEDVKLPAEYMLGDAEGRGFVETMRTFDCNRAFLGIMALGKAEISLEEACEYTKQRVVFGKPLAKFEGISFKLAEAATKIELGKWICYKALWMKDQGLRHSKESAMAKWYCPKTSVDIIHDCLLMHGHYGYAKGLPFEHRLREVIGEEIGDGTAEIMKIVISRDMLGREFLPY